MNTNFNQNLIANSSLFAFFIGYSIPISYFIISDFLKVIQNKMSFSEFYFGRKVNSKNFDWGQSIKVHGIGLLFGTAAVFIFRALK